MGHKNHKKAIDSLNKQIAKHQEKIKLELEKDFPDQGLIRHWEKEIRAFEENIQKKLKRLGQ
jgi:peptidoglycan hydrolase CwlO-like protein